MFGEADAEGEHELGRTQDYGGDAAVGRIPYSAFTARGGNRHAPTNATDVCAGFLRSREAATIEEAVRPRPEIAEEESAAKRGKTAVVYQSRGAANNKLGQRAPSMWSSSNTQEDPVVSSERLLM